jgi:hypothetical protein
MTGKNKKPGSVIGGGTRCREVATFDHFCEQLSKLTESLRKTRADIVELSGRYIMWDFFEDDNLLFGRSFKNVIGIVAHYEKKVEEISAALPAVKSLYDAQDFTNARKKITASLTEIQNGFHDLKLINKNLTRLKRNADIAEGVGWRSGGRPCRRFPG